MVVVTGECSFKRPGERRASCFSGPVTKLRTAGLLLILGSAITLGLHLLGAPEDLYRWLYHHLLGGLDVPDDPHMERSLPSATSRSSAASGSSSSASAC